MTMKVEKASVDQVRNKIEAIYEAEEEEQNMANSSVGGVPSLAPVAKSVGTNQIVKKRVVDKDKEEGGILY
jgi:hypothetical protein